MLDTGDGTISDLRAKTAALAEVMPGLKTPQKTLPPKLFYDERGMELFDKITMTPEYYLTRAEIEILTRHAPVITDMVGPRFGMVDLGGADSRKARILLTSAAWPLVYAPVDVSPTMLRDAARHLRKELPALTITPLVADFTKLSALPTELNAARSVLFYCAGSTLGNFTPARAATLLGRWARLASNSWCLVGIDLKKDRRTLEAAYTDAGGVTAAFNLNILARLNRDFGSEFNLDDFEHVATYDEVAGCMSMFLRCRRAHAVRLGPHVIRFEAGESIRTEDSYKYTVEEFRGVARSAGLIPQHHWLDSQQRFAVHLLSKPLRVL